MTVTEPRSSRGLVPTPYGVKYGFSVPEDYFFKSGRGLSHELVDAISSHRAEPDWMRKFRHRSLDYFNARPLPTWGGALRRSTSRTSTTTSAPRRSRPTRGRTAADIPGTWDKLGIPEAEKYTAGVGAQYESEVVYHKLKGELERQVVLFLDMDSGLREHEDIVREYFGTSSRRTTTSSRLNSAVRSGGSFIYVPPGVKVGLPLQAYCFPSTREHGPVRANADHRRRGGRLRALRREGCTTPIYSSIRSTAPSSRSSSSPAGAAATTIKNWSNNVFNLVTKQAVAYENATMEWVDGNLGSKLTMKYPAIG